jgi:TrmH family RNA methyltransferase
MSHQEITSLHSPHVERVKALLGSRGKKIRNAEHLFIADGMQSLRGALNSHFDSAPKIEKIYATEEGLQKIAAEFGEKLAPFDVLRVSDAVMNAMTDTSAPQGMLALCSFSQTQLFDIESAKKIAYFWQLQDPGNAGTVIRTADACGFDAIVFSNFSVDIYSPKVVRSTAGSLWNIPVVEDVPVEMMVEWATMKNSPLLAFDGGGQRSLMDLPQQSEAVLVFGNEARGIPDLPAKVEIISIPMLGSAESFNVASAAAIAMFHVSH